MYTQLLVVLTYLSYVQSETNLESVRYLQSQVDKIEPIVSLFQKYKTVFGKSYRDEKEELERREIFKENVNYIQQHNLLYENGHVSYTLGVNDFTDLSHREFLDGYTSSIHVRPTENSTIFRTTADLSLPSSIDWKAQGYVTDVKNQGTCGSCWAFSATGAVEGQLKKKTGRLVSLSEQQMIDCDKTSGNGCGKGHVDLAFAYIHRSRGLERETDYPYKEKETECRYDTRKLVPGSRVYKCYTIRPGNERDLQKAVATVGPISASIDASHKSFQFYRHGIYNERCCSQDNMNHAVLVTGYGTYPRPFWMVKNSYGKSWGLSGYIMMSRNANNQCGIATQALFPVLG